MSLLMPRCHAEASAGALDTVPLLCDLELLQRSRQETLTMLKEAKYQHT